MCLPYVKRYFQLHPVNFFSIWFAKYSGSLVFENAGLGKIKGDTLRKIEFLKLFSSWRFFGRRVISVKMYSCYLSIDIECFLEYPEYTLFYKQRVAVLLNTYNHYYTETHFIFSLFWSMSMPRFIYVVSLWFIFHFQSHFHHC